MSNVTGRNGRKEKARSPVAREGGLSSDYLFPGNPELLVTLLLMGSVFPVSQGRYEEPVRS